MIAGNISSACYNYTPYEREEFRPETYWLHHVRYYTDTMGGNIDC